MTETEIGAVKTLIATYTKKRDDQLADLCKFETGEFRLGAAELGTTNDDISQQWIRELKIRIADLSGLLSDLDGMRLGTRTSI